MAILGSRRAVALVIAVALGLAATSISIGYLTDDHAFRAMRRSTSEHAPAPYDLFRFESGSVAGNTLRIRVGHLAWWAAPDLKIHFLRPLTSLVFAADDALFGTALAGHLVSLGFHLVLLLAAAAWFRRLLEPPAATLALAIFGCSAAHVEAYAWISARHAVIAAAFAAGSLALRATHRRTALAVLAVGLTASEATLAALPLWVACELASDGPLRGRLRACLPPVALGVAYLVVYTALDFGTRGSGGYHDPLADPLAFLGLVVVRVPLLLGDAALGIPAELAHVTGEPVLAGAGLVAVALVALARPRPLPRHLAWLAAGGVAATVLGAAGFPAGRMLVIPDLAFAPLLGLILYQHRNRLLAAVLALAHLGLAPLATLHTVRKLARRARTTHAIALRALDLAPPSGRLYLLAASDPMVYLYPRAIVADEAPGAIRCWSTFSAAHASHLVTRTGPRSFSLIPLERPLLAGSFDRLFRARPFAVGDTVEQCGAAITVAAVADGLPTRIDVAFHRRLEDLTFVVWRDGALQPFTFPPVDHTVAVPWSPGPTGAF